MNIIDIIAIIPYFITLATVVAEEEDTLNLPKAPVSPQVCISTRQPRQDYYYKRNLMMIFYENWLINNFNLKI